MVKSRFTVESHPFDAPPIIVNVAVLFDEVYVLPSIQITGVQEVRTSVPADGLATIKFKNTTESHPEALIFG